jgi:hypothetical protein
MVIGFRLSIRCRLVLVWWMTNKRRFCFIITLHNFATLENRLTYQCSSSWPVVITMKKNLAGTWKNIQNIGRSNVGKTGRSCEGADFSWLSSKVSRPCQLPTKSHDVLEDNSIIFNQIPSSFSNNKICSGPATWSNLTSHYAWGPMTT